MLFTVVRGMRTLHDSKDRSDPAAAANRNSCILMLVIYAVLTVIYTLVLQSQVTAYALPLALGLAIFGTLFLASMISAVVWPGEVRWLRAAMRGEWPDDGALCAVSGRLAGDARPAPISEQPALAWAVDIYDLQFSSIQNQTLKVFRAKAMGRVPVTLDGAAGSLRLVGLLELKDVAEKSWTAGQVLRAATALRSRPDAKPFLDSLAGVGTALDDFATRHEAYDEVRIKTKTGSSGILPDDRVEERILSPGQEVCAFGIFDRSAGALRGRRVLGVERVQIMLGGPRRVAARLMRKTLLGLAAMTLLFVLSHGLVGAVLFLW